MLGLRSLIASSGLALALLVTACGATPDTSSEGSAEALTPGVAENPDVQTADEIAAAKAKVAHDFAKAKLPSALSASEMQAIKAKYAYLDPNHEVPADLLQTATAYFAQNQSSFPNQGYITVVDFKPRSDAYRFFLVNMTDGSVEKYHTTHGTHSDEDKDGIAESFGNDVGSGKSSLGFIRTAEVYSGTYHVAVRLDGLSDTNSNIRERAVVFHGWDGVHEANVIQGWSWGCITLDWTVKDAVLAKIKEGSLMYVGVSGGSPQ
jgi:hypothetical protein